MKRLGITLAALLVSFNSFALTPMIGADLQWRSTHLKGFNRDNFKKSSPALNLHTGLMLTDLVSLEAGFHVARGKHKENKCNMRGLHVTGLYHHPITQTGSVQWLSGAGLTHLKHSYQQRTNAGFDIRRVVVRATTGLQMDMSDSLAWRTMLSWENSSALKHSLIKLNDSYVVMTGLNYSF